MKAQMSIRNAEHHCHEHSFLSISINYFTIKGKFTHHHTPFLLERRKFLFKRKYQRLSNTIWNVFPPLQVTSQLYILGFLHYANKHFVSTLFYTDSELCISSHMPSSYICLGNVYKSIPIFLSFFFISVNPNYSGSIFKYRITWLLAVNSRSRL